MNIVSVMAHQDDELMCLGTMLRMRDLGHSLSFICLTDGCTGMVQDGDMPAAEAARIRCVEMTQLTGRLNARYICLNEEDEALYDTKAVRVALIGALRETCADVIFTHFAPDYNLDHITTTALVRQCAMQMPFPMIKTEAPPTKTTPAVFLTEPSGGFEFEATHWVDITGVMDEKAALSLCHQSQDEAFLAAFGTGIDHWVRKTAEKRGEQCGVRYAEAYRPMLSRGFIKPFAILP